MNGVGGQQLQTSFEELAGKEYVFQIRNSSNNQAPVVEGEDGEAAASASNNAAAGDDEPNLLKRKRIVTNARLIDSSGYNFIHARISNVPPPTANGLPTPFSRPVAPFRATYGGLSVSRRLCVRTEIANKL
ncbi:hypothetical protein DY000_02040495 [Brassica cretica]|uniref:Uncharacterized protein n=1 Tax=Brassica cretica TaxID=69181 RepID=A0ABQ7BNM0_BRACR|nr:hypothetical protein DY000_02040495 [Brassica cretica]